MTINFIVWNRIPCDYKKQKLSVRVEETSQRPHYLAIKLLYQGGQTDIVAVDVAQVGQRFIITLRPIKLITGVDLMNMVYHLIFSIMQVGSSNWRYMSRKYGTVWDTSRVPMGALQFRLVVTGGFDGKWVWAPKVLPADWRPGMTYDSGIQITDIAQEGCSPCNDQHWS
uniref:Expansin-like CBD domain-containing protein n=1 Tax=Nelumbo nucifera TaxID=4432 RepID=A0A822ZB57_NELNU|nr:TPA_asm: hypothetical protein HUJ06_016093 [Nelumbo nucifera]